MYSGGGSNYFHCRLCTQAQILTGSRGELHNYSAKFSSGRSGNKYQLYRTLV